MVKEVENKIPTAQEKLSAEFEKITRLYRAMQDNATQIAATRRALYLAYIESGFEKNEALDLVKGSIAL